MVFAISCDRPQQLAVVLNEHRGAEGIITIEDLDGSEAVVLDVECTGAMCRCAAGL